MGNATFMRFPEGVSKALTLSYDDGVEQDIRLIDILNAHGLKATFNINAGCFPPEGTVFPKGKVHRRMTKNKSLEVYSDSGHEVAVHSYTHPRLEAIPPAAATMEIVNDRAALEEMFNTPVRGMAYPYGSFNDTVVEILKNAGIAYSRTTVSTKKFDVPTDWLRMPATCHHSLPELMQLAEKFVTMKVDTAPKLFYLWGHTYEFEQHDNWNVIEEFAAYMGHRNDVWYATNIEIFNYVKAYESLEWSVDLSMVKNPTATTVWALVSNGNGASGKLIKIAPGELLHV